MKTQNNLIVSFLLILGVIILINILAKEFFFRLDFTEDNRYTLSEATEDILDNLDETVTVSAYFSEELPPQFARVRRDFKEMLIEYQNASDGNVEYTFINPNESDEIQQKIVQQGIQPAVINVREKDQVKQQRAYFGAIVHKGEMQKDVIPFVEPGAAMEYALSSSIKKVSVTDKKTIGILQGHGEPSISEMQEAVRELRVLYQVEPVRLSDTSFMDLSKYKTIAVIAPKDSFPALHLKQLDQYLARGGNLYIAYNRVKADFQQNMGSAITTGMESWLAGNGVIIEDNFVVDNNCGAVMMQQGPFQVQVAFPYLPFIVNFNDHAITKGLEKVLLQFASSMRFEGDTSQHTFEPLLRTSEYSGTQSTPLFFNPNKEWTKADYSNPNLVVGGVVSGKLAGDTESKMVVIADGDFAVSGSGQQRMRLEEDNVSLMVNAIDWLSDDTGLIALRTKGITARPIEEMEQGTKTLLKYLNFLLPIILVIVYGIIRMQYRRTLRVRRMQEGYV